MKFELDTLNGTWYYIDLLDGFVVGRVLRTNISVFGVTYTMLCADEKTEIEIDPDEIQSARKLI